MLTWRVSTARRIKLRSLQESLSAKGCIDFRLQQWIFPFKMFDRTRSRNFLSLRRQGAKLRIFSESSELGVFAPLRESCLLRTAARRRPACAAGNFCYLILKAFSFARPALVITRAVEWARFFHGDFLPRRHENELAGVRRLCIELECFLAYRHARAALQRMAVVVNHLLPRTAINHRLVALDAGSLFPLVGSHGDGAKLNAFNGLVWLAAQLFDLDAVELGFLESGKKFFFLESAGNARAPKIRIFRRIIRHRFVADAIRNYYPPAASEHPVHLAEELPFVLRSYQVQNAVGYNHIDGFIGDQRLLLPHGLLEGFEPRHVSDGTNRILLQISLNQIQIGSQVLDLAAAEFHVVIAQLVADGFLVFARQLKHRRIEIDADHFAAAADDLGHDVTGLAAAGAQIQNRLPFANIF